MNAPCAVLIAPDRTTKYLATVVETELDALPAGDLLDVRLSSCSARLDLAAWAIGAGHRVRNPFDHESTTQLLLERTA